jgi:cytochrome c556
MSRCGWPAAVAGVLCVIGVASGAAQPLFSARDLDTAMKAISRNMTLFATAVAARDIETAKMRVARAREQLFPTVAFWRNNNDPEAVKLLRQAVTELDELDVVLSADKVDDAAVRAAVAELDAACQRCHAIYRQEDAPGGTFSLKPRQ